MALMHFGDFDDMFGRVDRMMDSMMQSMFGALGNPCDMMDSMMMPSMRSMRNYAPMMTVMPHNSYSYSSSVMSYSTDRYGRPQLYEATHSQRSGPGGVKETRSSVRDSTSGYQEMAVGHHIDDRAHIMRRSQNYYTGDREDSNEFINLEEEEADSFNNEWQQRIGRVGGQQQQQRHHHRMLPAVPEDRNSPDLLALPAPDTPRSHSEPESSPSHSRGKWMQKQKNKRNKKPYRK